MTGQVEQSQQPTVANGLAQKLWRNRAWWVLSLAVLAGLLGIIYILGHLSSADSEMYPTSSREVSANSQLS